MGKDRKHTQQVVAEFPVWVCVCECETFLFIEYSSPVVLFTNGVQYCFKPCAISFLNIPALLCSFLHI